MQDCNGWRVLILLQGFLGSRALGVQIGGSGMMAFGTPGGMIEIMKGDCI